MDSQQVVDVLNRHLSQEDVAGVTGEIMALQERRGPRTAPRVMMPPQNGSNTPPLGERTQTGSPYSGYLSNLEAKPEDVTLEDYSRMSDNGMISFGLALLKTPVLSILRSEPGVQWKIECPDEKLRVLAEANFGDIRMDLVSHQLTSLTYGFAAGEKVWEARTGSMVGLPRVGNVWWLKKVKPNHPETVEILRLTRPDAATRRVAGDFDGYEQDPPYGGEAVTVPWNQAFVQTHRKSDVFGNLYGQAAIRQAYPYWYWLEIVIRAMLRYVERRGTPVVLAEAPSQQELVDADGVQRDALDYALQIAMDVAKSSAIAIPSDIDPDKGTALWKISYLQDDPRGEQFIDVIRELIVLLLRSMLIPERVATQDVATGSYNMAQTHLDVFLQVVELILVEVVSHINKYILPDIARFNFGDNHAPVKLWTTGIDRAELQRQIAILDRLIAAGHPSSYAIDVKEMAASMGLPVLAQPELPVANPNAGVHAQGVKGKAESESEDEEEPEDESESDESESESEGVEAESPAAQSRQLESTRPKRRKPLGEPLTRNESRGWEEITKADIDAALAEFGELPEVKAPADKTLPPDQGI